MKIVFAGTPQFAVEPLKAILAAGYDVVGVIAQTDKPQGRKGILTPPPVKAFAQERGIPVIQPVKIRDELPLVRSLGGEAMITCAYGQILSQEVLDLFPLGVWNLHASLLPKYRGASPIQSCVLCGDKETGVTVMKTALGMDTGDILFSEKISVGESETCGELSDRLSLLSAKVVLRALPMIEKGDFILEKQREEEASAVRKISKEQAKIDFSLPPEKIVDFVRGMNPEPVAFSFLCGERINVYLAEKIDFCASTPAENPESMPVQAGEILSDSPKIGLIVACGGGGAVKLVEVQAAGGKRMSGGNFLSGRKAKKGQVFSC